MNDNGIITILMGKKGFDHWAQSQANGAWRIDFYRLPARLV